MSKYAFCIAEDINLGAGYIISYLEKQGHEVKLFFDPLQYKRGYSRIKFLARLLDLTDYNVKQIVKYEPDYVLFSCVTATYGWALNMARKIKRTRPQSKVIFGGVHPTLVPEEVRKHKFIDQVIEGDGIEALGLGKFEPDKVWADREKFFKELPPEHRRTQLFMTSFGCPFSCSFCGQEQLRKVKHYKKIQRSVDGCIKELEHLKNGGMRYVLFVDDIFTCNKHFLHNFLPAYEKRIGLPFACFGHPKFLDRGIVEKLRQAGCHTIWIGIQTGYEGLRKAVLNRHETNKEIVDACKLIKDAGIKLMVDHIFGIPQESNTSQDVSYGLYREIKADVVNCYNLLYFPKAKIIEHAIKSGHLTPTQASAINRGEGNVYQIGARDNDFMDKYQKAMIAIPLGSIIWELLPEPVIKLIVHLKAGRAFMLRVIIENEIYFTMRAIWKKIRSG